MTEDQIKQIRKDFEGITDMLAVAIAESEGSFEVDPLVQRLCSMCRALLDEPTLSDEALKGLIEYHQANSKQTGFREGVETAAKICEDRRDEFMKDKSNVGYIKHIRSQLFAANEADKCNFAIRALLPPGAQKEEG